MARVYNELRNYQNVPRELVFDKNLSDRARFVYVFMACKPDDWDFYLEPMAKDIGYSVDTLRKYINELATSGWLIKGEQTNENGVFGAVEYTLKATKKTDTEFFRHGENTTLTNNNTKRIIDNKQEDKKKENKEKEEEFIEEMYKLYPTKCPVRGISLNKSSKDKDRIRRLLKQYSMEDIENVIRYEIEEKYNKHYMQNFSTFLNNFPDPQIIKDMHSLNSASVKKSENMVINGQIYR